jgi:hypothetical protein
MMPQLHIPDSAAAERLKYEEMWDVEDYHKKSPGLENVDRFMSVIKPKRETMLLDAGCGAGVAGLEFASRGLDVHWLDITGFALKEDVPRNRFIEQPLWQHIPKPSPVHWQWGFCCDVMEHIPPEYTMAVVLRLLRACRVVWFQIAFFPDGFGQAIGKDLHLTVMPYSWWLEHLSAVGKVIDARDLCGVGMFVVQA